MSHTVVVIDDSPFIFKAVKKALEPEGLEVVGHAINGQLGLEMVASLNPDYIVLDITMPVMDGLETARQLFAKDPGVKVVMLSAMGDEDLIRSATEIGIKQFITKPFKPAQLLEAIGSL